MSSALALSDANAATEALALAAMVRDSVASGVERRALMLRFSRLPEGLRDPRNSRLLAEALAPMHRPTRARVFELPSGDRVVVAPPPGQHLEEMRADLARLLPETDLDDWAPLLRLPDEAAALLGAVEDALGLGLAPPAEEAAPPPPAPSDALDAALRALAGADVAAVQRRAGIWRLAPGDEGAVLEATDIRAHIPDLVERLLPGCGFAALPGLGRRFRRAVERRLLADLVRPPGIRNMGAVALPLALASVTEAEALRLYGAAGPEGRRRISLAVPLGDALADAAGLALAARYTAARGLSLGFEEVEAAELARVDLARLVPGSIRLRFRPALLSAPAAMRDALDAALPEDRGRIVLTGVDAPVAIAWAWQRGITRFMGRVLEARRVG
jgi:hypothetical protein